ncbi:related to phosphatidylinositol phospholipase [Phialocephala subalpina]|uniref:Related to phosphatidylinositol phospholipase n=1 Tax=Phialocephala subalpina TaxID=576137 RepID=A0A1L7WLF4_9HELO|nr:related to phosphatidylinositol phospholipase [Phialocephala subalpina]
MLGSTFTLLASLAVSTLASPIVELRSVNKTTSLADLALQKVLFDASPIFGYYVKNETSTSRWMEKYPDSTKIVHMNIPGVHDTQTWNYSLATQEALDHVTDLDGVTVYPPEVYRCQQQPIISMLNAGIRVFDLRVAFDPTNSTLVFWHSQALQSETATMDDVLFGFYKWLDDHPSEALLLSFNYEGSTTAYAQNNAAVQMAIYDTLTTPAAKKYFVQTQNEFGTLGEARGKITLLRRFSLSELPASYSNSIQGVYFDGNQWFDNNPDITLVYNSAKNLSAYIEDFYEPGEPYGQGAAYNIDRKYNATTAHIIKATTQYPDSLFWTFASSENDSDNPIETPEIMALGNGTATPLGGVNQRLIPFLKEQKGKRVGIVMFDFFDQPGDLVQTFLDI